MKTGSCATGRREPCQMGNQAAISGLVGVLRKNPVGAYYVFNNIGCNFQGGCMEYGVSGNLPKMASSCF